MKRLIFYLFLALAFFSRAVSMRWYMALITAAHRSQGVKFNGKPDYIHQDAYLDPTGGLTIGQDVVISTRVVILTHDWSFLKRTKSLRKKNVSAFRPVCIGSNSFIGAGAIVLPGTKIGINCIIGAGAVVKGDIDDYSIVIGNPCKVIDKTS